MHVCSWLFRPRRLGCMCVCIHVCMYACILSAAHIHVTMSTAIALLLSLGSMMLWGSWANTMLAAKVRFEAFFVDYMVGNAIVAAQLSL